MKREKLQQLTHLVAGIITLVYGFDAFESGQFLSASYYLALAIIFLIVAGSHKWIVQKFMKADIAFNLLEAIAILYCGNHYKEQGHQFLYYLMTIAGLVYVVFAVAGMFQKERSRHRSSKRKKRKRSSSQLFNDAARNDNNL